MNEGNSLNVQMIEKSARIHIKFIANEVEKQWRDSGAITDDEGVYAGILSENGGWYINFTVYKKPVERKILKVNQMP